MTMRMIVIMTVLFSDFLKTRKMHFCVNFVRYILLLFLSISVSVTFLCLGVDLDWLINGPAFVAKVMSRIKEK